MPSPELRISDLGEFQLIDRLRTRLGQIAAEGDDVLLSIGDDAACLRSSGDRDLLLTTDIQMEGRHFLQAAMSGAEIGARSVSVCLSDILAMGGRPDHLLISLGLPGSFLVSNAEGLYDGIRRECERWNCRSPQRSPSRRHHLGQRFSRLKWNRPSRPPESYRR